jgi:hypothetical protein
MGVDGQPLSFTGGDAGSKSGKVAIAAVIWENTTMNMPWISQRLSMQSAVNASQQTRRYRISPKPLPKKLKQWTNQSRNVA